MVRLNRFGYDKVRLGIGYAYLADIISLWFSNSEEISRKYLADFLCLIFSSLSLAQRPLACEQVLVPG
jgi:hypothetical protein